MEWLQVLSGPTSRPRLPRRCQRPRGSPRSPRDHATSQVADHDLEALSDALDQRYIATDTVQMRPKPE